MPRIVLVSAYASVRAGLHTLLSGVEGITVVGTVNSSEDLERLYLAEVPDVVVFDDHEGDRAAMLEMVALHGMGLVMLVERGEEGPELFGRNLSGWACLGKEAECEAIAAAVQAVASGLIVLEPAFAVKMLASSTQRYPPLEPVDVPPDEVLTPREQDVLQLVAKGLANKQIAARLAISLHTVKFHVASILAKLGATSRTEAVTLGARRGQVTL